MNSINALRTGSVTQLKAQDGVPPKQAEQKVNFGSEKDTVELSKTAEKPAPPELDFTHLAIRRISAEKVAQINAAGAVPHNAKFVSNGVGGYALVNNIAGITPGTQIIPQGYEVKNDVLGFTNVVPVGTSGLLIK